jgi:hypothetical protein
MYELFPLTGYSSASLIFFWNMVLAANFNGSAYSTYVEVLHHELLSLLFHVGAYETGKVEVWSTIQIQLIFEHLMNSIGYRVSTRPSTISIEALTWCTVMRYPELWNLLSAVVARRVGSHMRNGMASVDSSLVRCVRVILQFVDKAIGVNLDSCQELLLQLAFYALRLTCLASPAIV